MSNYCNITNPNAWNIFVTYPTSMSEPYNLNNLAHFFCYKSIPQELSIHQHFLFTLHQCQKSTKSLFYPLNNEINLPVLLTNTYFLNIITLPNIKHKTAAWRMSNNSSKNIRNNDQELVCTCCSWCLSYLTLENKFNYEGINVGSFWVIQYFRAFKSLTYITSVNFTLKN